MDTDSRDRLASASLWENLRFNFGYVLPHYLQGIFQDRPFWVGVFSRLRKGPMSPGLGERLRDKYDSKGIYVRFLATRCLMLFDQVEVDRVLEKSPTVYADPPSKRKGMSHFQPEAVTLSRGEQWSQRRKFNEDVLLPGRPHTLSKTIHSVVREETLGLARSARDLKWRDFADLFERVALRVLFGRVGNAELGIAAMLTRLMSQANRGFLLRRNRLFKRYRAALNQALETAGPGSLARLCLETPSSRGVPVGDQVTHWLFAFKDTVAENAVRTLAVIESLPEVRKRSHEELASLDLDDVAALEQLPYLEACLHETMRMWPTTPLLVREVLVADTLCGVAIDPGAHVLIPNVFNHFDARLLDRPLEWRPERWCEHPVGELCKHFSAGAQSCPGADLALFVGKGVLGSLMKEAELEVLAPQVPSAAAPPRSCNPFAIHLRRRERSS